MAVSVQTSEINYPSGDCPLFQVLLFSAVCLGGTSSYIKFQILYVFTHSSLTVITFLSTTVEIVSASEEYGTEHIEI